MTIDRAINIVRSSMTKTLPTSQTKRSKSSSEATTCVEEVDKKVEEGAPEIKIAVEVAISTFQWALICHENMWCMSIIIKIITIQQIQEIITTTNMRRPNQTTITIADRSMSSFMMSSLSPRSIEDNLINIVANIIRISIIVSARVNSYFN